MVTKKKGRGQKTAKTRRVKVGKLKVKRETLLKLNKETVKDLSRGEATKVKGGFGYRCSKLERESCVKLGP